MRGDVVAREHAQELVLRVQDGVEEEERAALGEERDALHLVLVAGVARRAAERGVFVEHEAVVDANGLHRGAAGKDGLSAAAVAGEVVVHDRAREDHVVDVAELLVDVHGRSAGGRAEVFEVVVIRADAVVHLEAGGDVFAHALDHFLVRHGAVGPEREDDLHVLVLHAETVHLIDEHRHEVEAVGDAGRVVADEGDGVAGLDDLFDRRAVDRVADRLEHAAPDVLHRRELFGADHLQNAVLFNGKGFATAPVGEVVGLHGHVLSP